MKNVSIFFIRSYQPQVYDKSIPDILEGPKAENVLQTKLIYCLHLLQHEENYDRL